ENFHPETNDENNDITSKEDIEFNNMEEVKTSNIRFSSNIKSHDTQSKSISLDLL
ncbi:5495_t:CDS:1, partial [Funneliformis geosporum]